MKDWIKRHPFLKKLAISTYIIIRRLEFFIKNMFSSYDSSRLHLGCGVTRLPGFCNVDVYPTSAVDILDDISRLRKFRKSSVDLIYSSHVLEHFSTDEVPKILKRWFEVLKPGGEIRLSVPDIDRIVKIYMANWEHFQKPGHGPWIGLIYGGQENQFDFHKTGFNFNWLSHLLQQVGFIGMKEYPHEPVFAPGLKDASLAKEPFGEFISLNIMAKKPT